MKKLLFALKWKKEIEWLKNNLSASYTKKSQAFLMLLMLSSPFQIFAITEEEKGQLVWERAYFPDYPSPESACAAWVKQYDNFVEHTPVEVTVRYNDVGESWVTYCHIDFLEPAKPPYASFYFTSTRKTSFLVMPDEDGSLKCEDNVGNPINSTTGNKYQLERLINLDSVHPIKLDMYYNSRRPEKWRNSYSRSVVRVTNLQVPNSSSARGICSSSRNTHLVEAPGGFGRIKFSGSTPSNPGIFMSPAKTIISQTTRSSPADACQLNWYQVQNKFHYSWVSGSTAIYEGNGRCDIYKDGVKRMSLSVHQNGGVGGSYIDRSFNCSDLDPTSPPGLDSEEPIRVRFTRQNGSLVRFTYNTITSQLDNDSQTGERAEFITSGGDITGYRFYSSADEVEEYDAQGKLISITSLDGHVQTLTYITDATTGSVLLDRVQNTTGEYIEFNYEVADADINPFNRISSINDHIGRSWGIHYDANDNPEYILLPDSTPGDDTDNLRRQYHYDTNLDRLDYLTGITDERGNRYATWTYNENGKADSSAHGSSADIDKISIDYNEGYNSHTVTKVRKSGVNDAITNISSTYYTHAAGGSKTVAKITGPECVSCDNSDKEFEYNPVTGYLEYKIENGIRTEYGNYDNKGNPGYVIEAAGTAEERRTDYTYDTRFHSKVAAINEASVYSSVSKVTTYTYDDYGNPTSINISGYRPDGTTVSRTTSMRYQGPFHQLSEIDGPRTDVSDVYYFDYYTNSVSEGNNRARLRTVRKYSGEYIRNNIQYTVSGKLLSEDRQNGLHIDYAYYPGSNRLREVTQTDVYSGVSRSIYYTYLPTGEIESITEGFGSVNAVQLMFSYDDARRLTRVTDGLGNYIDYILDTEGNLIEQKVYDAAGALKKSMAQTFDSYNQLETSTQLNENRVIDFNPDGTIASITDGKGFVNEYDYDGLKRLVNFTQDNNGSNPQTANSLTEYVYDVQDNLISVKAANDAETTYAYDDLGNLQSRTSPDTGTVNYHHDAAGNIVQSIDAKGVTFFYSYDSSNRLLSIDAPGEEDDTYLVYGICSQGEGKLCHITRNKSTLNYRYNAFSDVVGIDQSLITWQGYSTANNTVGYDYDAAGRVSSIKYPSGTIINYAYNAAGKVDNVHMEQDGVITNLSLNISYLPFGKETVQTYGNGISVMGFYDQAYRPFIVGDPTFYFEYISAYDENGNIKSIMTLDESSYMNSIFDYDEHQRLMISDGFHGQFNYSYDKVGNKQTQVGNGLETTFAYSANSNRLTELNGEATNMDDNGNITSLRGMVFTYTADNRLKTTNTGAAYEYNGLGQRTIKHTIAPGVAGAYTYSQSNSFIYGLNGELLAEIGPGGSVKKEYVYLNNQLLAMLDRIPSSNEPILNADLDNDGEISVEDFLIWYFNHQTDPVYEVTGDGIAGSDDINAVINCALTQGGCIASSYSTEIYYVHNDHLGKPKMLTNINGQPVWRASATPFGKASVNNDVDGDGGAVGFNIRQPGQYYDRESGLYYNYYRYYDPETGRYITSDPIGLAGGINTYTYALNNPLRYTDPTGLVVPQVAGWIIGLTGLGFAIDNAVDEVKKTADIQQQQNDVVNQMMRDNYNGRPLDPNLDVDALRRDGYNSLLDSFEALKDLNDAKVNHDRLNNLIDIDKKLKQCK